MDVKSHGIVLKIDAAYLGHFRYLQLIAEIVLQTPQVKSVYQELMLQIYQHPDEPLQHVKHAMSKFTDTSLVEVKIPDEFAIGSKPEVKLYPGYKRNGDTEILKSIKDYRCRVIFALHCVSIGARPRFCYKLVQIKSLQKCTVQIEQRGSLLQPSVRNFKLF